MSRNRALVGMLALAFCLLAATVSLAQDGNGQDGATPRETAPIDLTGYWVSLISEDWRFRMTVAQKGDWDVIPLNAEGQRIAAGADLARDEATGDRCKAYGAAGIMRIPGRLHISWEGDSTLRIDTDAGMQTRSFLFGESEPATAEFTLQGHSVAEWSAVNPRRDIGGSVSPGGELRVETTQMLAGYYFKHGVPYSGNAVMHEYFARVSEANGDEYLFVTSIVEDPAYLTQEFVRTLVFKREPDGSKWNPSPCSSI